MSTLQCGSGRPCARMLRVTRRATDIAASAALRRRPSFLWTPHFASRSASSAASTADRKSSAAASRSKVAALSEQVRNADTRVGPAGKLRAWSRASATRRVPRSTRPRRAPASATSPRARIRLHGWSMPLAAISASGSAPASHLAATTLSSALRTSNAALAPPTPRATSRRAADVTAVSTAWSRSAGGSDASACARAARARVDRTRSRHEDAATARAAPSRQRAKAAISDRHSSRSTVAPCASSSSSAIPAANHRDARESESSDRIAAHARRARARSLGGVASAVRSAAPISSSRRSGSTGGRSRSVPETASIRAIGSTIDSKLRRSRPNGLLGIRPSIVARAEKIRPSARILFQESAMSREHLSAHSISPMTVSASTQSSRAEARMP